MGRVASQVFPRALNFACLAILFFAVTNLSLSKGGAIPKPKPSNEPHKPVDVKLSDEVHFDKNQEHNDDYDHEAFLGEEAKTFDDLTPEESKKRLAEIVDKIDKDKNGLVTEAELQEWIKFTQRRYIYEDVERQWTSHEMNHDSLLSWDEYLNVTYGFLSKDDMAGNEDNSGFDYKEMISRDRTRFTAADGDKDDKLTQSEFADFLHPEETKHMQHIVIQETLNDIDKDKDGFVSLDEYIADMYHPEGGDKEEEPEWVTNEKEQFKEYRDKDKDGKLNTEEVKDWIIPPDYDHTDAETKHLIFEADADKDGKLSKEEIIEKYDVFVGSQATDFGEALIRHDEFWFNFDVPKRPCFTGFIACVIQKFI